MGPLGHLGPLKKEFRLPSLGVVWPRPVLPAWSSNNMPTCSSNNMPAWSSNNNRPPSAAGGGCAAAVVVAGKPRPGQAQPRLPKAGPGQTKPRLGTTGKPAKPKQAALGFLEGKSKLGFESWGAAFGKHLPRNPTFGISKLGF